MSQDTANISFPSQGLYYSKDSDSSSCTAESSSVVTYQTTPPKLTNNSISMKVRTVQILLVIFNMIFVMCGFVFMSVAIWTLMNPSSLYSTLKGFNVSLADVTKGTLDAIVLGVCGAVLCLPGLLGCCGALLGRPCLLYMYAMFVSGSLLLQFGGGLVLGLYKEEVETSSKNWLQKNIKFEYLMADNSQNTQNHTKMSSVWDQIFINYKCCGAYDFRDFLGSTYQLRTGNNYPQSCCQNDAQKMEISGNIICQPYNIGCFEAMLKNLMEWRIPIGCTTLLFTALEIMAIVFSVYLARTGRPSSKVS